MRHGNHNRKFGRKTDQRRALLVSLSRSLILKKKMKTTEARAKEIRPMVEKLITRGKNPTLTNHRMLVSNFGGEIGIAKKIETIAAEYKERTGGYLRITKLGQRASDGSPMAVIEFV